MRLFVPALLALAACTTPSTDTPTDDTGDTATTTPPPPLPVAHCGLDYTVLDDPTLGTALSVVERNDFDLISTALDALLTLAGFESLTPVPYGVRLFRYRYVTQDRGELVEATGLIGIPAHLDADPDEPWPVALLLHGFAGVADACAPSRDTLLGPALPALLAANGFVVITPDYIGLKGEGEPSTAPHAPLVGEQMAFGAWDGVRAARALLADDLKDAVPGTMRDDLVIWGASQGGHGALWADLTADYLAPEEDVVAVVAASPAVDLKRVVEQAVGSWNDATGLAALAFVGMRRWYGAPDDLTSLITNKEPNFLADNVEAALTDLQDDCEVDATVDADEVSDVYADAFVAAVNEGRWDDVEPWTCFVEENSLTLTSVPRLTTRPTMLVFGEEDSAVAPLVQEGAVATLCGDGWALQTLRCDTAGHAETTLWSVPEQIAFLRGHLAGEGQTPSCTWPQPVTCSATPEEE